ncbi:FAD-dependent oxidoreductase [Paraburkholderia antibiotica]|uniref:FAD-dependent oxidoreductase n=1 Tax=Paraburkholderia antibiotica TaxID=2728839 RepID=A0A7X9ZXT8_9BURK|nr:FAD-dependent oxidoreductase [Paraburkholderia antibiotica]NML32211.1 FAD-dependent oxidoreductase [Paraburkholderia antibiotica]
MNEHYDPGQRRLPSQDFLSEPARSIPIRYRPDVLVVGGGPAGIAAATAAARSGASVLICERNGYLGGALTMVTLGSICGLYAVSPEHITPVVRGIGAEIAERLHTYGGTSGPMRWLETASLPYDPNSFKLVADDLTAESGVELAFHCSAVAVTREDARVTGVIFEGVDGRWACMASSIIDCTGDGTVAALAGAGFEHDVPNGQAPTTMFRFGGVDVERARQISRPELHACLERAVASGLSLPRTAGGAFSNQPHSMHLNITRILRDGVPPNTLDTRELSAAEVEGRRQLRAYLQAFREFVPGYEGCFIADIGASIGVRESRRVMGDYRLTLDDVLHEGRFEDAIACSAWPVEEHGAGRGTRWVFLAPGTYYQIPLRTMLPEGIEGLLVAGRCASASHDAHASMRVAGVCFAMGEAAGVVAAQAASSGTSVRNVDFASVRADLLRRGAFLGEDRLTQPV